jgi:hypothetical protein
MIEYLPLVLTGIGLTASIIYYANILNNANKARERDFINQRILMLNDEFYFKWRKLIGGDWSTYQESLNAPDDEMDIMSHMSMLLNSVGILHQKNMISSDLVFSVYLPNFVIWTWEKVAPVTYGIRESMNNPDHFSGFEYLYNVYKKKYPNLVSLSEFQQSRAKILEETSA